MLNFSEEIERAMFMARQINILQSLSITQSQDDRPFLDELIIDKSSELNSKLLYILESSKTTTQPRT
ncbi:TPA: hypothetical protein PXJ37_002396 [Yersinia enterocolitica]|uniref:hypothetical protein n=1 Tax=Yersinia TaxID=629 RepID=UPI0005E56AD2|nr:MULTISPECIES: hypothetical protein [Yersinia]EKN3395830.1 hypothetical protein [Yersinia enterocolitica]EKN3530775.1 hypothetical protein [Yersinia enterocolitica]EKN3634490.1 hypothetical protein [Yersinia enterocolitica]EKN3834334.1 hypothetical protein [Yersinia enterocolitica]EKN4744988.1 hypothetical protein [Yersinia enterocolitica]